jgi:transcriptional regulator with XRE-family HTH domain
MVDVKLRFGKKIKEIRKELGLSQERFANRIGIDRTYFQGIENGSRNVSIVVIEKIAYSLNIKMSELLKDL